MTPQFAQVRGWPFYLWFLTGLLLCGAAPAAEQGSAAEIGLKIGDRAPGFVLKDQDNRKVSLESLLKKGPVALVFVRSANWCMFCKFELVHLQRNLKEIESAGGQVVSISYDSSSSLNRFAAQQHITFPLLSDEKSKIIDAYSVRDNDTPRDKPGFASHVTFILDQAGIVRTKYLGVMDREQPGLGILLKGIKEARKLQTTTQQRTQQS